VQWNFSSFVVLATDSMLAFSSIFWVKNSIYITFAFRMKRIFEYILALGLLSIATAACAQSSLMWKVVDPENKSKVSYVFGTIHLQDSALNCFGDEVWDAIESCDLVAGELDMTDPTLMMTMMTKAMMKDSTLEELLTKKELKELNEFMLNIMDQTSWAMFQNMKPFFLMGSVLGTLDTVPQYTLPMDMRLMNAGIKTVGLETIDEQLAAIDNMSLSEQANMLMESIQNIDSMRTSFLEMKEYYLRQDIDGMVEFMSTMELDPQFSEGMIEKRNYIMAERLTALLRLNTVFCAVGAGHLPGDEGLLQLLREQGFEVSPVPFRFLSEGCR